MFRNKITGVVTRADPRDGIAAPVVQNLMMGRDTPSIGSSSGASSSSDDEDGTPLRTQSAAPRLGGIGAAGGGGGTTTTTAPSPKKSVTIAENTTPNSNNASNNNSSSNSKSGLSRNIPLSKSAPDLSRPITAITARLGLGLDGTSGGAGGGALSDPYMNGGLPAGVPYLGFTMQDCEEIKLLEMENAVVRNKEWRENYKFLQNLHVGSHGKVFSVKGKTNHINQALHNQVLCVKQIQLPSAEDLKKRRKFIQEAKILSYLKHPNVVSHMESFVSKKGDHLYIVMEFCQCASLRHFIDQHRKTVIAASKNSNANAVAETYIQEERILSWFVNIAIALVYLHLIGIYHLDLNLSNILITSQLEIKIADFGNAVKIVEKRGTARNGSANPSNGHTVFPSSGNTNTTSSGFFNSTSNSNLVTLASAASLADWMGQLENTPPEILEHGTSAISAKCDSWMLGVILYELCTLSHPFLHQPGADGSSSAHPEQGDEPEKKVKKTKRKEKKRKDDKKRRSAGVKRGGDPMSSDSDSNSDDDEAVFSPRSASLDSFFKNIEQRTKENILRKHKLHNASKLNYYSPNMRNLIYLLLKKNPAERPSVMDILRLDYLRPFVAIRNANLKLFYSGIPMAPSGANLTNITGTEPVFQVEDHQITSPRPATPKSLKPSPPNTPSSSNASSNSSSSGMSSSNNNNNNNSAMPSTPSSSSSAFVRKSRPTTPTASGGSGSSASSSSSAGLIMQIPAPPSPRSPRIGATSPRSRVAMAAK